MMGRFFRLTPLRFSGAVVEDANEFLTIYPERLYTSCPVEFRGVNYTAYQLDRPAR